jgi:UDP-N-acetylglucosamine 2-epimerase (non-hydrolysing)
VAKLVGPNYGHIVQERRRLLDDDAVCQVMAKGIFPYGDGRC